MTRKILWIGSLVATILVSVSCDKNNFSHEDNMVIRVVYAVNSGTKTALDGMNVIWEEGDKVCCIATNNDKAADNIDYTVYENIPATEIKGASARFEINCGQVYTPQYLIYPTSDKMIYKGDGVMEIPVAESYTLVPGNMPKASNISVGAIDGDQVLLRNTMTLVKFEVPQECDPIKSIAVISNESEALGGTMTWSAQENQVLGVVGSSKIYLYPPKTEAVLQPGIYYFPLPSIALAGGFKVEISRNDGLVASKSYDQALSLPRNEIMNIGNVGHWNLEYKNTVRIIEMEITDGSKFLGPLAPDDGWPFTEEEDKIKAPKGFDTKTYTTDQISHPVGLLGPYTIADNEDADFYFYLDQYYYKWDTDKYKAVSDGWRQTEGAGFRFGGTPGDYMVIPAIQGYRIASVYVLSGKKVKYAIMDNPEEGEATVVKGGEEQQIAANEANTFALSGTKPNTSYRLVLTSKTQASIFKLTLTYETE